MATKKKAEAEPVKMPSMMEVKREGDSAGEDAGKALEVIRAISVRDGPGMVKAIDVVRDVKERAGEIDNLRRRWVDPLNAVVKDINGFFKPAAESLKLAEKDLKGKVSTCFLAMRTAADLRLREVQDAIKAGDRKKADALVRQAQELEPPKIPGVSVSEKWDVEVLDASAVPDKWKVPDVGAIEAAAKAAKGDPGIPGVRAVKRLVVSVGEG